MSGKAPSEDHQQSLEEHHASGGTGRAPWAVQKGHAYESTKCASRPEKASGGKRPFKKALGLYLAMSEQEFAKRAPKTMAEKIVKKVIETAVFELDAGARLAASALIIQRVDGRMPPPIEDVTPGEHDMHVFLHPGQHPDPPMDAVVVEKPALEEGNGHGNGHA